MSCESPDFIEVQYKIFSRAPLKYTSKNNFNIKRRRRESQFQMYNNNPNTRLTYLLFSQLSTVSHGLHMILVLY